MTQLPKKSLFAAYSNDDDNDESNKKNILFLEQSQSQKQQQQTNNNTNSSELSWLKNSSFKVNNIPSTTTTTTATTTTSSSSSSSSPSSTPTIKKRASDFFNLDSDYNDENSNKKEIETHIAVEKSPSQPINKKQDVKKRSFIDSSDSDSSSSSSSDSSNSDSDDGFIYKRNKFKKEQEKERKKEKRDKKKKRKEKEKKYYSNDDRSIIVNELFENKNKQDYYIETLGDKTNYTIGFNNKSIVPNYNYDNFKILGLKDSKITFNKKDGFQIESSSSTSSSSSSSKQLNNRYFIKPTTTGGNKETIEKVKPISNLNDPSITNQDEIKLIVIDKDDKDSDNDEDDDEERKLLKKNSELNKLVEQFPNNEEYWINLVLFQENFLQFSNRKGKSSKIAMYEKQLSIYRNSLLVNPNSELLTINYLKLASKIWDQQKVFDLWNKLIDNGTSSNGSNGDDKLIISENLWKEYIEFSLSNFNEFKIIKMKDTIISIIKKLLIKRRSFKIKSDINFMSKVQLLEESILQFILQLTKFLNEAGFSERVIGIYQSLIEFNCFEPIQLSNETQATLLKEFKKYWSSSSIEFPKIGESNSIGWSKSYSKLLIQNIEKSSHRDSSSTTMNLDNLDNLSIEEIELLLKEQEEKEDQLNKNQDDIFNIVYNSKSNIDEEDEEEYDGTVMKTSSSSSSSSSPSSNNNDSNDEKIKFNKWGKNEIEIGEINWKPLNIDDIDMVEKEVNEKDTERVVLFNDFYELLFRFVKEENKIELVFQFLEFLGVPISLGYHDKLPPRFPFNHPLRRESINSINENNVSLLFNDLKQQQSTCNTNDSSSTTTTTTTTPNWFTTFDQITNSNSSSNKLSNERIQFIELVYKQILENSNAIKSKEKLYISFILFKASIDIEEAKRYTKSLCEKFKQLIYFDIFASLEIKCGKIQEAKKIYQTTCQFINQIQQQQQQQQQQPSSSNQIDLIYREYFFMELNSIYSTIDKDPQILKRFIKSGMKPIEMFTLPLHILQCYLDCNYKQYSSSTTITIDQRLNYLNFKFNQKLKEITSTVSTVRIGQQPHGQQQQQQLTVDFILCYCIFQLLLNGFDGFIKSFKQFVDKDESGSGSGNKYFKEFSIEHELITVKSIEMVTKIAPLLNVEPWKIKNLIIESLDNGQYFDHPKLLTLFLNWESQNQIINRVRIYFDLNNSKLNRGVGGGSSSSSIFWLFSIKFESNRLGAAQRIKSLFERAIGSTTTTSSSSSSSNCKHNILLWKLYIEFEIKRGRLKIAKSIYYRAIKELPWSKLIWLLPFTNDKLSSIFDENELIDIIKLINEKGIRLRITPPLK